MTALDRLAALADQHGASVLIRRHDRVWGVHYCPPDDYGIGAHSVPGATPSCLEQLAELVLKRVLAKLS